MISEKRRELLIQFESFIGNECYNSNIQNYGPGGVFEGEGREYRYPITFIDENHEKIKTRYVGSKVEKNKITNDMLFNGYYAFGANELHVMQGLKRILNYLEEKFDVDFDK